MIRYTIGQRKGGSGTAASDMCAKDMERIRLSSRKQRSFVCLKSRILTDHEASPNLDLQVEQGALLPEGV